MTGIKQFNDQLMFHLVGIQNLINQKHGNIDGLETTISDYLSSLPLNNTPNKRSYSKKEKPSPNKQAKKERTIENQCQARIWGTCHDGSERCFFNAHTNGLCTKHAKAESQCAVPCTLSSDGTTHIGLFYGRIDQFQEGEPGIPPYKDSNGCVRIKWTSDFMRRHISNGIEQGTCKFPNTGLGAKKTKKTKKTNPTPKTNSTPISTLSLPSSITEAYTVLGLPNNSTSANIKQKYHALAREFHPDKVPDTYTHEQRIFSMERFKQISSAWEILQIKIS